MKFYEKVDGKLKPEDAEECVQAVVASQCLEGLETPPDEVEMLRAYASGDISEDEYMAWVWRRAGVTA